MELNLKGKTALVTGASMGLGRATAAALAQEGVRVLAVSRTEALLQSLAAEVEAAGGTPLLTLAQDFVAPDGPARIAAEALEQLGGVDILVNNAGGSRPLGVQGSDADWDEAYVLNFTRHRQLTQALLPHMIARRSGRIVNISGTQEPDHVNAAAAAKSALVYWSKGLSHEIGQFGITVNCVEPGLLDTAQIRRLFTPEARKALAEREISLGDFGDPIEVARAVTFLASAAASYITGIVLPVDGGMRHTAF